MSAGPAHSLNNPGVASRRVDLNVDAVVTEVFPHVDDSSFSRTEEPQIVFLYASAGQSAELCRIAEEAVWSNILASTVLHPKNARRVSKKKGWGDGQVKEQIVAKEEPEFRLLCLPDDPMDADGDVLNGFMFSSTPPGLLVRRNPKARRKLSEILQLAMSYSERQALKLFKRRDGSMSKKDIKKVRRRRSGPSQLTSGRFVCVGLSEDCIPAFVDGLLDHNDGRQIENSAMQNGLRKPCEKDCSCPMAIYLRKTLEIVAAAVSIQAAWRSSQVRKNLVPSLARRILEGRASVCVQRWWRMRLWCSRRTFLVKLAKLWDKLGTQLAPPALGMSIKLPMLALTRILNYFRKPPALSVLSTTSCLCFDELHRVRMCRESIPADSYFPLFPSWMDIHLPVCGGHISKYTGDPDGRDYYRCEIGPSISRGRKAVVVRLLKNLFYQTESTFVTGSIPGTENHEANALLFRVCHSKSSSTQLRDKERVVEFLFQLETASANELLCRNMWDCLAELQAVFTLARPQARAYVFMLYLLTWDPQDCDGAEMLLLLHTDGSLSVDKEKVYIVHGEEAALPERSAEVFTTIQKDQETEKPDTVYDNSTIGTGGGNDIYVFDDGLTAWKEVVAGAKRLSKAQKVAWQTRVYAATQLSKTQRECRYVVVANDEKFRIQATARITREEQGFLLAQLRYKDELRRLEYIDKVHTRQREAFCFKKRTRLATSAMKNFAGKVNKLSNALERHGHRVSRYIPTSRLNIQLTDNQRVDRTSQP